MVNTECEGFIFWNMFSVLLLFFPLIANFNNQPNLQGPLMRCLQPLRQLTAQLLALIGRSTRYITKRAFSYTRLGAFLSSTDSNVHHQKDSFLVRLVCLLLDLQKDRKAAKSSEKVIRMSEVQNG